jgi:hypothetical protein
MYPKLNVNLDENVSIYFWPANYHAEETAVWKSDMLSCKGSKLYVEVEITCCMTQK